MNPYIRRRGIILIAAHAKWDVDYKIDKIIDKYLKYKYLKYKPDLKDCVVEALHKQIH